MNSLLLPLPLRERIEVRVERCVKRISPIYTSFARKLRESQTDVEKLLWYRLRNKQIANAKFRRQHKIGSYIVDFISIEKKLIIEIDGGQHDEEEIKRKDEQRTKYLEKEGYRVLRFWNNEVLENLEGVLENIHMAIFLPSP